MFASVLSAMHITVSRLIELCAEPVVQDEIEAAHLRTCEECRLLLRAFAEDRAKYLKRKGDLESEILRRLNKSA